MRARFTSKRRFQSRWLCPPSHQELAAICLARPLGGRGERAARSHLRQHRRQLRAVLRAGGLSHRRLPDNSFVDRYDSFNKLTFLRPTVGIVAPGSGLCTTFGAPGYINRDAVASGALSPPRRQPYRRAATNIWRTSSRTMHRARPTTSQRCTFRGHDIFNRTTISAAGSVGSRTSARPSAAAPARCGPAMFAGVLPVQLLAGAYWRSDSSTRSRPDTARVLNGPWWAKPSDRRDQTLPLHQLQVTPTPWLKLTGAARYDQFYRRGDSSRRNPTRLLPASGPEAGVSVDAVKWLELYGNYGQGFADRTPPRADPIPASGRSRSKARRSGSSSSRARYVQADAWTTLSENESFQAAPACPSRSGPRPAQGLRSGKGRVYVLKPQAMPCPCRQLQPQCRLCCSTARPRSTCPTFRSTWRIRRRFRRRDRQRAAVVGRGLRHVRGQEIPDPDGIADDLAVSRVTGAWPTAGPTAGRCLARPRGIPAIG